jgi:iron complex transport system ATP-binding protein
MTLIARDLTVSHGSVTILDHVSLTFDEGSKTAIVGPNGAGKSTLVRALAGLEFSGSGSVRVEEFEVPGATRAEVARRLSLMTQRSEAPSLRVIDVVLLGRSARLGRFGVVGRGDVELAARALDDVGVLPLAQRSFPTLSGGERQRAMFALQTVQEAPVALFDEPTSAQDFAGTKRMIKVMHRRAASGDTIVAVVHDLNLAIRAFDRIVCLNQGRVVADGLPAEVIQSPALHAAFEQAICIEQTATGLVVLAGL